MRAAVLHAPGDLRVEEVPLPAIGDEDVLVRVMAAGICGSDIARVMTTGTYRFPTIPGHEFAGVVEAVGGAVASLVPGDRVAVAPLMPCFDCPWCRAGTFSLCDRYDFMGSRSDGAFAEFVRAPARNVVKVPECVAVDVAATVEPAAIILHGIHKLDVALGDAVAVVGCGALGFFALQFARLSGAQPLIALDVDPDKLDLARRVGADVCIDPSREDAVAAVKAATGGRGVAVALECAGSAPGRDLAIMVAEKQGRVMLYGTAHGPVTFAEAAFSRIVRDELEVVGSWNSYSLPFPGKEWFDIIELLRTGRLDPAPLITHRATLDEAPAIFAALKARTFGSYGKILIRPNG